MKTVSREAVFFVLYNEFLEVGYNLCLDCCTKMGILKKLINQIFGNLDLNEIVNCYYFGFIFIKS
ncbi:hypothetical protein SAMN05421800_101409 [Chryseobacterium balustinum]|uniref:Uncharacterized protein n=1 Tax=Chryseobacterium balustinum TaxID=246 RepID=A0AAX2IHK0_9FLAO|nr:hypothetical protein SAMN05421800_101409 [Chryseobacterium balustinum]SQA87857.1 Uncharacterised protein [Chryseobacterium balustinum]